MTTSLTEFLLARTAEDKAVASNVAVLRYDPDRHLPAYQAITARVLAECEAKRRIVEDLEEYAADYRAAPSDFAAGRRHAALLAATRVAAVYADHPDYDEEWRD